MNYLKLISKSEFFQNILLFFLVLIIGLFVSIYWAVKNVYFRHIFIIMCIFFSILLTSFSFLEIYARHNEEELVPNLIDLKIDDVKKILKEKNLRFEIIDSIYDNFNREDKRGKVVTQDPNIGNKVKKNRRIFLTINAFNNQKIKMPNVVGVSYRQAKVMLISAGFKIGDSIPVLSFYKNLVKKQELDGNFVEENAMLEKGTKIDLFVGVGKEITKFDDKTQLKINKDSLVIDSLLNSVEDE